LSSLISIIIPTYNRAHLICETITSIQKQSYTNWECIIVDDASTDNTEYVISKYLESDSRISFYKKPECLPKGPSASRNYGFTKSSGTYINWFDSDDLMHPKKLEIDLKQITTGDFDFTISQSDFFKDNGTPKRKYWNKAIWSLDPINDFIISDIGWGVNSPLWVRNSLEVKNLVFNEELMTADDYLYHIQALEFGFKPVILEQVLVCQREHKERLNDYVFKSPSKLLVNYYLIKNKEKLKLNNNSVNFLKIQFYGHFNYLLKHRDLKLAFYYLKRFGLYGYNQKQKMNLYRNVLIGVLYKVSGYGYRYLK